MILMAYTPYITPDDRERIDYQKNKAKWIVKNGFCNYASGKSSGPRYIDNFMNLTPYVEPMSKKFREIKKEKWTVKKNFEL